MPSMIESVPVELQKPLKEFIDLAVGADGGIGFIRMLTCLASLRQEAESGGQAAQEIIYRIESALKVLNYLSKERQ